eukprot:TRINITY_DN859_c0_g1_i3.p1 TRINITY_DN859_c0_g1~~TRINITY_DN859_c0_g1_i3.p1  ORF type:complete len:360 (+),score=80.90 TRINITY_DN859_c0_g1_i3:146-1225(+)
MSTTMSEEECKCTVYGVTPSYFTMKLVAAFEWTAVPFELKHKTLENKEWLEARSGTQQVPVLLVRPERWVLNDTTPILHWLDALQRTYHPQHAIAFYPPGMKGALVATLEEFFDEWVTRAALHFRWNYPESAAFAQRRMGSEMAGDGAGAADTAEMVGNMIERWGHMATKAVGLSEPTMQKALEEQFHRLLHRLDVLLAQKGRRFIFGPQPTALDAVVIGGMRAHFLNDPTPTAMLQKYAHIKRYVKESAEFNAARIERAKAEVVEGSEQLREFVLEVLHQMSTCFRQFSPNAAAMERTCVPIAVVSSTSRRRWRCFSRSMMRLLPCTRVRTLSKAAVCSCAFSVPTLEARTMQSTGTA